MKKHDQWSVPPALWVALIRDCPNTYHCSAYIVIDRNDPVIGTGGAYSGYPAGINVAN